MSEIKVISEVSGDNLSTDSETKLDVNENDISSSPRSIVISKSIPDGAPVSPRSEGAPVSSGLPQGAPVSPRSILDRAPVSPRSEGVPVSPRSEEAPVEAPASPESEVSDHDSDTYADLPSLPYHSDNEDMLEDENKKSNLDISKYMLKRAVDDNQVENWVEPEVDEPEQDNVDDCYIIQSDHQYPSDVTQKPNKETALFRQDVTLVYREDLASPIVVQSPHYEEEVTSFCSGSESSSVSDEEEEDYGNPIIDNAMDLKQQIQLVRIRSQETILEEEEILEVSGESNSVKDNVATSQTNSEAEDPMSFDSFGQEIVEKSSDNDEYTKDEIDYSDRAMQESTENVNEQSIESDLQKNSTAIQESTEDNISEQTIELERLNKEYEWSVDCSPIPFEDLKSELKLELGSLADSDADLRDQFEYCTVRTVREQGEIHLGSVVDINLKDDELSDLQDDLQDEDSQTVRRNEAYDNEFDNEEISTVRQQQQTTVKTPPVKPKRQFRKTGQKLSENYDDDGKLVRSISEVSLQVEDHSDRLCCSLDGLDSVCQVYALVSPRGIQSQTNTLVSPRGIHQQSPTTLVSPRGIHQPSNTLVSPRGIKISTVYNYEQEISQDQVTESVMIYKHNESSLATVQNTNELAGAFEIYATQSAHFELQKQIEEINKLERIDSDELECDTEFINVDNQRADNMPDIIQGLHSNSQHFNIVEDIKGDTSQSVEQNIKGDTSQSNDQGLQSNIQHFKGDTSQSIDENIKFDTSQSIDQFVEERDVDTLSECSSIVSSLNASFKLSASDHTPKRLEDGSAPPTFLDMSTTSQLTLQAKRELLEEYHNTPCEDLETSLSEPKELPLFATKSSDDKVKAFFVRLDDPYDTKSRSPSKRSVTRRQLPERPKSTAFGKDSEIVSSQRSTSYEGDLNVIGKRHGVQMRTKTYGNKSGQRPKSTKY